MKIRETLLHPATLISLVALFVALGGVGYAASLIGTKQIKNRAVTGKKLGGNSVTSSKIKRGAVGNSDLATNSVTTTKLRAGAVANSDLAANAVSSSKIGDNSIITGKLADSSILSGKLATNAVTDRVIAPNAVSSGKLADASVTSGKLAANAVTGTAIAPNAVSADKIADGQVVEGNGVLMNRETALANGASDTPILTFAGLGTLQGDCAAGVATIEFVNTSGTTIDVRQWGVVSPNTPIILSSAPANGGTIQQSTAPNGIAGITWMASFRDAGGLHLVTINVSTKNAGGATCPVSAQGVFTSG